MISKLSLRSQPIKALFIASTDSTKAVTPRAGSCASGWYASDGYCVSARTVAVMRIVIIVSLLLLAGCAAVGVGKSDYFSRLQSIDLGMTKVAFRSVFPESVPRGAKQYPNGTIEVLEVAYQSYAFIPSGNRDRNGLTGMEAQSQWFYFYNGKLIQYGNPNDWPSNPDLIIETRSR
jgi:hypothetical protein